MDSIEERRKKHLAKLNLIMNRESQSEYFGFNKKEKLHQPLSHRITKRRVKDTFTDIQLLDMVDDSTIQNYLRSKKLKKIKDKI